MLSQYIAAVSMPEQAVRTQEAFQSFFDLIDPAFDRGSIEEIEDISSSVKRSGEWVKNGEWRLGSAMQIAIRSEMIDGKQSFDVTVAGNRQSLSRHCDTVERAFAYYKLYQHIIICDFYKPWSPSAT